MNFSSKRTCLLLTLVLLLILGTTMVSAQTITAQYLYVSGSALTGTQGRIAGYRVAADGTLTQTQGAFPTSEPVNVLLPSAQGAKLFALGLHKVWVFTVNPADGTLKLLSSDTFPQNIVGTGLAVNPTSTLLFVSKTVDGGTTNEVHRITTYKISPAGVITSVASVAGKFLDTAVDSTGRFLYATVDNPTGLNFHTEVFSINNTTGALTLAANSPATGLKPSSLAIHPNNKFVYEDEPFPAVEAFTRNATTGALTRTEEVSCGCDSGPDFATGMALNGSGTVIVQAVDDPDSGLAIYTIDQTNGNPSPQPAFFIPFGFSPVAFTVDKANGLIYGIDADAKLIKGFHLTDAGATSPTAQGSIPFPADESPTAVRVLAVKR